MGRVAAVVVFLVMVMGGCAARPEGGGTPAEAGGKVGAVASGVGILVDDLRCEYAVDPRGVDLARPRLSWVDHCKVRGAEQRAYQILVGTAVEKLAVAGEGAAADVWDSGMVKSDESVGIVYGGKALEAGQTYYWMVRVWGKDGLQGAWSKPARWTMGLLAEGDWQARWIAMPGSAVTAGATTNPSAAAPGTGAAVMPIFRRRVALDKPVRQAELFICGLGQFELHVNGKVVGDGVLEPGWTDYKKTCLYRSYDVLPLLRRGENVLGVMLGNGMYHSPKTSGRYTKFVGSFGPVKLIASLHVTFADGTRAVVGTDGEWRAAAGPITFSSEYGGEDYDARREQAGWDGAGFDDGAWAGAAVCEGPGGELKGLSRSAPEIKVQQVFSPRTVKEVKPGVYVYDMGQNVSMMPRITVRGPAGAKIKLTPGELLNADGTVTQKQSGGPMYYTYTLKGKGGRGGNEIGGEEVWQPRFTYYGARYVQMEGGTADAPFLSAEKAAGAVVMNVEALGVWSSAEEVGSFSCSNELFNKTATLIDWAIRSNLMSVMTDCPHREKLGWLEESHLMGPSVIYRYDVARLLEKITGDMTDAQHANGLVPDIAPEYTKFNGGFLDSPEWGSAAVLVPWQAYEWYGDRRILEENYSTMEKYVAYLGTKAKEGIVSHGLGDWYDIGPKGPGVAQLTPIALTATAFYYRDLVILGETAKVLGKAEEAARFETQAGEVRAAFNTAFFNGATGAYASAKQKASQTGNALPLVFGMVAPEQRAGVMEAMVKDVRERGNALTAGDVGYRYLLRALAAGGRSDVIFDMNSSAEKPGYGYQLAHGATSLTEAWDARASSSQNHFMLGHILEWFYHDLAGIAPEEGVAGFRRIVIRPQVVGDVTWAKATYKSVRGEVGSSWRIADGVLTMAVEIPVGATARVYVPGEDVRAVSGNRNSFGWPMTVGVHDGVMIFEVGSGEWEFRSRWAASRK